jgi:hypothetical protein
MEKKIEKSEFLSKVEAFAHEMTTMTEKKEGVKRGLVILAAESVESENGTKQIISVLGSGKVVEAIAGFASQEHGKSFLMAGMKEAALNSLIEKVLGGNRNH